MHTKADSSFVSILVNSSVSLVLKLWPIIFWAFSLPLKTSAARNAMAWTATLSWGWARWFMTLSCAPCGLIVTRLFCSDFTNFSCSLQWIRSQNYRNVMLHALKQIYSLANICATEQAIFVQYVHENRQLKKAIMHIFPDGRDSNYYIHYYIIWTLIRLISIVMVLLKLTIKTCIFKNKTVLV